MFIFELSDYTSQWEKIILLTQNRKYTFSIIYSCNKFAGITEYVLYFPI